MLCSFVFAETKTDSTERFKGLDSKKQGAVSSLSRDDKNRIKYYQQRAKEEIKILNDYISCLGQVDRIEKIQVCNSKRKQTMMMLNRAATPKKPIGKK